MCLSWLGVNIGWVVPLLSTHQQGLGRDPGLYPVVYLLCGHCCFRVVTYHYGKHLTIDAKHESRLFNLGYTQM